MFSALEAVMGRDAPLRVGPHPVTDFGMTQGKLHLSKPNVFHQGHRPKAKGGSAVLNQLRTRGENCGGEIIQFDRVVGILEFPEEHVSH